MYTWDKYDYPIPCITHGTSINYPIPMCMCYKWDEYNSHAFIITSVYPSVKEKYVIFISTSTIPSFMRESISQGVIMVNPVIDY